MLVSPFIFVHAHARALCWTIEYRHKTNWRKMKIYWIMRAENIEYLSYLCIDFLFITTKTQNEAWRASFWLFWSARVGHFFMVQMRIWNNFDQKKFWIIQPFKVSLPSLVYNSTLSSMAYQIVIHISVRITSAKHHQFLCLFTFTNRSRHNHIYTLLCIAKKRNNLFNVE